MLMTIIFITCFLTGLGVYDVIGAWGGAGSVIPITGFSNAVSSPSIEFKKAEHPVLKYLEDEQYAAPVLYAKWEFEKDVNVLTLAHPPMDSVYGVMPDERFPAYVERKYGQGRAYYMCGTIGETMCSRNKSAYRQLIKGFCEYNARKVVECEEKGLYEVVLRRQEDKYLLHLVNMTGAMQRPIERSPGDMSAALWTTGRVSSR